MSGQIHALFAALSYWPVLSSLSDANSAISD